MDNNDEGPKGVREPHILANIKVLVTRFDVVENGVEVSSGARKIPWGNRYLCKLAREFGVNWVDLTSLRLQVKDLKSVYICTRAKFRRGGSQIDESAGLS